MIVEATGIAVRSSDPVRAKRIQEAMVAAAEASPPESRVEAMLGARKRVLTEEEQAHAS